MKYLISIFALYFLSLTVLPCMDAAEAEDECNAEMTEYQAEHEHSDETSGDFCSPFCSCHCCHIYKMGNGAIWNAFFPVSESAEGSGTPFFLSHDFFSVWHPPQG